MGALAAVGGGAFPRPSRRAARARVWPRAAPRSSTPASACSQRRCHASRLASILRRPCGVRRETTTRRSVSERTRSTWPLLSEVIEHLRDRRRRQPRRRRELPRGQLAALVELDQQLELGVAELCGAEMRVAPAQSVEAAEDATKRQRPARSARSRARPARQLLDGVLGGRAHRLVPLRYAPSGSTAASALAAARLSRARGFSARSSTMHGISPSAAVPNDHQ